MELVKCPITDQAKMRILILYLLCLVLVQGSLGAEAKRNVTKRTSVSTKDQNSLCSILPRASDWHASVQKIRNAGKNAGVVFAFSTNAAGVVFAFSTNAAGVVFAFSTNAAGVVFAFSTNAAGVVFAFSTNAAGVVFAFSTNAAGVVFAFSTNAAGVVFAFSTNAAGVVFAFSTNAAGVVFAFSTNAAEVVFAFSTNAAGVVFAFSTNAAEVVFAFSTNAAGVVFAFLTNAAGVVFAFSTNAAEVVFAFSTNAAGVVFAFSTNAAEVVFAFSTNAAGVVFAFSTNAAGVVFSFLTNTAEVVFAFSTNAAGVVFAFSTNAAGVVFAFSTNAAGVVFAFSTNAAGVVFAFSTNAAGVVFAFSTNAAGVPLFCDEVAGLPPVDPNLGVAHVRDRGSSILVYCDVIDRDGKAWIIIQRRRSNRVSFNRTWDSYVDGFGSFKRGYWLGLRNMSRILALGEWEIRFEFKDDEGGSYFAQYDGVKIEQGGSYGMTVGNLKGKTVGLIDALKPSRCTRYEKVPFITRDSNVPDERPRCASRWGGAWWAPHDYCPTVNLNGVMCTRFMHWFKVNYLVYSQVMIRRTSS
ncbi:hypothetical protein RRG08_029185 [Elysia crispata]|uniref:Fibrinogen C-terminal domain-containing protein n=1 Tax=Elysia crispata TaxID=231223 RepID=A0AAE1AIV2_9GAST|nr:hypothetical protein RRG08_029185 [Elysia crispata]